MFSLGQRVVISVFAPDAHPILWGLIGKAGVLTKHRYAGFEWGVKLDDPKEHEGGIFPANSSELLLEEGPW